MILRFQIDHWPEWADNWTLVVRTVIEDPGTLITWSREEQPLVKFRMRREDVRQLRDECNRTLRKMARLPVMGEEP